MSLTKHLNFVLGQSIYRNRLLIAMPILMINNQLSSKFYTNISFPIHSLPLVSKVNLPIGETKNRVPYVKVRESI